MHFQFSLLDGVVDWGSRREGDIIELLTDWMTVYVVCKDQHCSTTYLYWLNRSLLDGWIPGVFSFWKRNTADGWTAFLPSTQLDIRVRERMAGWKLLCLHLVSSASSSSFIYRSTHYGFLIRWLSVDRRSKMGRRGSESKSHTRRGMGKEKVLGLTVYVVFHEKLVLVLFMVLN